MKTLQLACLFAAYAVTQSVHPQNVSTQSWNMSVRVLGDSGLPMANAQVTVGFSLPTPLGEEIRSDRVSGVTDTNGVFTTSHSDTGSISLGLLVQKDGFYPVHATYDLSGDYKPEKWNLNPTWTLKKIIEPIPMYAKSVNLGAPVFEKPAGYDLMSGDWVAPYGKGVNADILFTAHLDKRGENDSEYKLVVSFPNTGDGIQTFEIPANRYSRDGSALRSSQQAPAEGYTPQWIQTRIVRPGNGYSGNQDENRNYYFRVRTVLDENGAVRSALYGKIYGDFMQFRYYINPTPNDRNVEFDPKRNLMKNLKSTEQVSEP